MRQAGPQLGYVPRSAVRRRRWVRRGIWLVVLAAVAIALSRVPRAWHKVQVLYYQRQCATYTAPADQLICSEPLPYAGETPPFTFAAPEPSCLHALATLDPALATTFNAKGPVLFLHQRSTPSGIPYLVVIRRRPATDRQSWDIPISFDAQCISLGDWKTTPLVASCDPLTDPAPQSYAQEPPGAGDAPLRFFAGVADPNDESHFTLNVETSGERIVLDGWLMDRPPSQEPPDDWERLLRFQHVKLTLRRGDTPIRPED